MGDVREELFLQLLHLVQSLRHPVERSRELADLVPAAHGQRLRERALRELGRGHGEPAKRAGHVQGQEAGGGQGHRHGRQHPPVDRVPGALLELAGLDLGLVERRIRRPEHSIDARGRSLRRPADFPVDPTPGRSQPPVGGKGDRGLVVIRALVIRAQEGAQEIEVLGHPRRPIIPGLPDLFSARGGVLLHAHQTRQLLSEHRAHAQGGQGLGGEPSIDLDQAVDGQETPGRHPEQGDDDQSGGHEDLVGQTHGIPNLAHHPEKCHQVDTRVCMYVLSWL